MLQYTIIIQKTPDHGFGAYVPDLPGCIGMGASKKEVIENIREAISFHLEGLKAEGLEIPEPSSEALSISV
ncbi:MAG: type II toxin-antitoxin system HicB family antitoxin [Saprospiraceae bacterium]|nr:type II toxin-antitoxin system HicB family antitoxin [Saprospiraceae bacterium]